eukprot:scaffold59131_cov39-Cyclotella_meneghiniana.AAC.3
MAVAAAAPIGEMPSVLDRECWLNLNGKDNGCLLVDNAIGVLATSKVKKLPIDRSILVCAI